jgi:hypothetical protein
MRTVGYAFKLLKEIAQFSKENRVYWMVPLFIILGLCALVIGGTKIVAPLIYALF